MGGAGWVQGQGIICRKRIKGDESPGVYGVQLTQACGKERKGKEKNSVPLAGWGTNPYCKVSIKHDILSNKAL